MKEKIKKICLIILGIIIVTVVVFKIIQSGRPLDKVWGIPTIFLIFIIWRVLVMGKEIVERNKIEKMSVEEREQYIAKLKKSPVSLKKSKIEKIIGILTIGILVFLFVWLIYSLFQNSYIF